jgi:7-cyano-7-deazaguanine synthase
MSTATLDEAPLTAEEIAAGQSGLKAVPAPTGAVVALSGGQDSTTCLYYAREKYAPVRAVSFDYGQRHRVELEVAKRIAEGAGVEWTCLHVPALAEMGDAGLTNPAIDIAADASDTGNTYAAERGLPSSFVPGRNAVLLSLAAAYGLPRGLNTIVTGVCQEDRAGYPDCRGEFVRALEIALRVGLDHPGLALDAPLLTKSKVQTWQLAHDLGDDCFGAVLHDSHTCYEGKHDGVGHRWGHGCGECPACELRRDSFDEWVRNAELARPIFPGTH